MIWYVIVGVDEVVERVNGFIGFFDLDPNRVIGKPIQSTDSINPMIQTDDMASEENDTYIRAVRTMRKTNISNGRLPNEDKIMSLIQAPSIDLGSYSTFSPNRMIGVHNARRTPCVPVLNTCRPFLYI